MKKWLPFSITFLIAAAVAAGLYIWKGSQIEEWSSTAQPAALGRNLAGGAATVATRNGKPGSAKSDPGARPTRNGVRSLFERASRIMEMDREEVEKLLAELEAAGGNIRSPLTGVNLMAA